MVLSVEIFVKCAGIIAASYLLGSIPWGIILTRRLKTTDIRHAGSGNIGATNVRRIAGTKRGLLTLLGDMLKGAIPVWTASALLPPEMEGFASIIISLAILAAILGHLFPIYLKLKNGGKGVATAAGSFFAVSPLVFLIAFVIFAILAITTNYMSVGSLGASASLPCAMWFTGQAPLLTLCAFIVSVLIFFRHKDNIQRLRFGVESRIWPKRKPSGGA